MSTPYVLTSAQCKELTESFVSPFTKASSRKQKKITQDAVDAITPSDASSNLQMEIKHVCTQRLSPADKPDWKVKEFLYNHGGHREGEKEMISYIWHLIGYMVAVHENKGILDQKMEQQHPGLKPLDKEYLGLQKVMMSEWYKEQPKVTHSMFEKLAETWNTEAHPPEVQKK